MKTKQHKLTTLFLVVVGSLFAHNLYAQGSYVKVNAGYGFSMNAQNMAYFDFYNSTRGNNSVTEEQVNVSLGKGANFGAAFGHMFNKNLGAELGISYLIGGKSMATDVYIGGKTESTLSSKMLSINPSLVIASGQGKINPYGKFGIVVGKGSVAFEMEDKDDGDIMVIKMKLDGGMAFGFTSAVGATFGLNDKISLFGECQVVSMTYAPTKGKITEATFNGKDELHEFTTSEKEWEYVNSYTRKTNSPQPDSEPSKELKQKLPFGSAGITLGVKITL